MHHLQGSETIGGAGPLPRWAFTSLPTLTNFIKQCIYFPLGLFSQRTFFGCITRAQKSYGSCLSLLSKTLRATKASRNYANFTTLPATGSVNNKKFLKIVCLLPVSVFDLYNEYSGASIPLHTPPWQVRDSSRQLVGCTPRATDSTVGAQ